MMGIILDRYIQGYVNDIKLLEERLETCEEWERTEIEMKIKRITTMLNKLDGDDL